MPPSVALLDKLENGIVLLPASPRDAKTITSTQKYVKRKLDLHYKYKESPYT